MRGKLALRNILSSIMLQLVAIICGFIVPRLIIETFGSTTNGLINSITQFLAYIALLESGFGPVVKSILYKPLAQKNKKEIENILKSTQKFFRIISYIFLIYIIILCMIYPYFVNNEFPHLYTISLILIIAISTFAEYFFGITYNLFLQADQHMYITSTIQIITTILNTIVIVILIKLGFNIQVVKIGSAIVFTLKPLILNLYVTKKYNINLNEAKDDYKIEQKWDGLAQHIAAVIHGNTDVAVLTIFSTLKEVSVYSVYILVINGIKKLVQAFSDGLDASWGDMIAKHEKDNLNKKFSIYETLYYTLTTIIFTCTLILLVPFIKVYTKGITDVNYIRPLFGFLITFAEYMWAIRLPYSSIVLSAGHFKQTQKGAWVEALSNIILSIILVFKYGIIGVAIGTLVAMTIRTIEFCYHSSKYILKRDVKKGFVKPTVSIVETLIMYFALNNLNIIKITGYGSWFIYAIIILIITSCITFIINYLMYKKDFGGFKRIMKKIKEKIR